MARVDLATGLVLFLWSSLVLVSAHPPHASVAFVVALFFWRVDNTQKPTRFKKKRNCVVLWFSLSARLTRVHKWTS
ncbi:hypothetical protein OUZ56_022555 [Daphnia magna]|uniref:Secreted protein n=1 Tax=Daphnia magna TaxID=35525 RepID=A0ABR0AWS4_9CRUS|nr:hypothetical protein OUZ56_022555 [Daphnia magna]